MKEELDPVVAQLRAARKQRGLSLHHVSELLGRATYQSVWQWESGTHDPKLSHAREWAQALGFDLVLVPAKERES